MLRRRKMLGLAVTSRGITAVEVVAANGGARAARAAVFPFPDGAALQEPVALGRSLKQFLRANSFSASRCVIGVEASRLTAREAPLPPAAGDSAAKILSLVVEREFASDHSDLVFDYAVGDTEANGASALLVAAPRAILDQLTTMAQAADLAVAGVTSSALALAGVTNGAADRDQLILHIFGGGAELALRARGGIGMMRRLPIAVPADAGPARMLSELADELRRVVALLPGGGGRGEASRELLIWDETGLKDDDCGVLSEQLGLPVTICQRLDGLELGGVARPAPGALFFAAAAMAQAGVCGRAPTIDLLNSRLSRRGRSGIGRKAAWAAGVAAAFVVAGTVLAVDWHYDRVEVAAMTTQYEAMAGDLAEAKAVIARVNFARPWYDRRPSYLQCMREVTNAFPQEGVIWATSLAIQEDVKVVPAIQEGTKVVLTGKAVSESAVLDVLDRLKANPKLVEVKQLYLRQAARQRREVAFSMSFTFSQSGKTWSSPSAKESSSRRR